MPDITQSNAAALHRNCRESRFDSLSVMEPEPEGLRRDALINPTAGLGGKGEADTDCRACKQTSHTLAENSFDTMARYDDACRALYANPAQLRVWSVAECELLGSTPVQVPGGMAGELVLARLEKVLASGREEEFEYRVPSRDNGVCWLHVRLVPERDSAGTVRGVLAIGRDVTLLKEVQELLEQSRTRLRRLAVQRDVEQERERKRIAHGMHEDLAQTLAVLCWELKLAQGAAENSERLERLHGLAEQALKGVLSTVDSIRPIALEFGIVPALERLVEEHRASRRTRLTLRASEPELALDEECAITLYRLAEHLIEAALEVPGTESLTIHLSQRDGHCVLLLEHMSPVIQSGQEHPDSLRFDLAQEMALQLGGDFVNFVPFAGTRMVEITIPLGAG